MVSRRLRVFLDTSVLIAGIMSPEGGAGAMLEAGRLGLIELYVTPGVIREASEKFSEKFPELVDLFLKALKELGLNVIPDPSKKAIRQATTIIADPDDAPMLAAAQSKSIDYLVTLDTKHFLTAKVKKSVHFSVVTPGEFLKIFQS